MNSISVLLVDDDPLNCRRLDKFLTDEGYEVHCASNGVEGLEAFRHHRPDVVISDIVMPEMNGVEMLSIIKAERPDTVAIVLSGKTNPDRIAELLRVGCNDILTKPVADISLVRWTMAKCLEQRKLLTQRMAHESLSRIKSKVLRKTHGHLEGPVNRLSTLLAHLRHKLDNGHDVDDVLRQLDDLAAALLAAVDDIDSALTRMDAAG